VNGRLVAANVAQILMVMLRSIFLKDKMAKILVSTFQGKTIRNLGKKVLVALVNLENQEVESLPNR
jgi:hypothetical protein